MYSSVAVWHETNLEGKKVLTCDGRVQVQVVSQLQAGRVIFVQNYGFMSFRQAVVEQGVLPPAVLFHGNFDSEPHYDAWLFCIDQVRPEVDKLRLWNRITMLAACPWQLMTGKLVIRNHRRQQIITRRESSDLELAARKLMVVNDGKGMFPMVRELVRTEREALQHCDACQTIGRQIDALGYRLPRGLEPLPMPCPWVDTLLATVESAEIHPYALRHLLYCDVCHATVSMALNVIHRHRKEETTS